MIFKVDVIARTRAAFAMSAIIVLAAGLSTVPAPAAAGTVQGAEMPAADHFVMENVGQYAPEARFLLKQGNVRIWLADDALWLTVPDPAPAQEAVPDGPRQLPPKSRRRDPSALARPGTAIRFTFPGANAAAVLEPMGPVAARVSYLIGNDPARWQRDVPVWSGIRYRDLYPGIDLIVGDGAPGTVPWRFEARAGADLQVVTLHVEGADRVNASAGRLALAIKGRVVDVAQPAWSISDGSLAERSPSDTLSPDQPALVPGTFVRDLGDATFVLGPDNSVEAEPASSADISAAVDYPPRILAGALWDASYAIAIDHLGNAYVTGESQSGDFPVTPGSYDPTNGGTLNPTDAFVAKLDATGTTVLYATYLGGDDLDLGGGIAVHGNLAHVVGRTRSDDFPGATIQAQGDDVFVVALNADGTDVRYASLLGGTGFDAGFGIAVDGTGAYLVGQTASYLPGSNCTGNTAEDVLVAKLNALGAPAYITCLGGTGFDAGYAIAVRDGVAYVTGESGSIDFPAPTNPGASDIVIAIFDASGTRIRSRLFGGALDEWGNSVAVDSGGTFYIAGTTYSWAFPGVPAAVTWGGGMTDAVLVKMDSLFTSGSYFVTFVGGNGNDEGNGIAIDTVRGLYMAGTTTSTNFPGTAGRVGGDEEAFVARMHLASTVPNKVTHATYLGGANDDEGYGIATDTGGYVFVTGSRASSSDPDSFDAFVAKLSLGQPLGAPVLLPMVTSGADAVLAWNQVTGAAKYQVFGSREPYFTPGDWSSNLPLGEPTGLSLPLTGALASPGGEFYIVKAVSAAPEAGANSDRLGKFTFQLVQGSN